MNTCFNDKLKNIIKEQGLHGYPTGALIASYTHSNKKDPNEQP